MGSEAIATMGCGASAAKPPEPKRQSILRRISQAHEHSNSIEETVRAQLIDGKALADTRLAALKEELSGLITSGVPPPCLAVVLVGDNPASLSYLKRKEKAAEGCGMLSKMVQLPADVTQEKLLEEIAALNSDTAVHGVLV